MPANGVSKHFSVYGYLLLLAFSLVFILIANLLSCLILFLYFMCFYSYFHPETLKETAAFSYLLFLLTGLFFIPFMEGETLFKLGIAIPYEGVKIYLFLVMKLTTLYLAVACFNQNVSVNEMVVICEKIGFRNLGFCLALAMNFIYQIRQMSRNIYRAMVLRGAWNHPKLYTCRLFIVTLLWNLLKFGDDVTISAYARGFGKRAFPLYSIRVQVGDILLLFTTLAIFSLVALVV
jgi:hypothetical protein